MIQRLKAAVRNTPTVYRTTKSIANRLQPVLDFTSTHFTRRRGRRFANAGQYFMRTRAAGYIGWVGKGNLGDEALFDAFDRLFTKHTPILYDRHPFELRLHQKFIKRRSSFFDFIALGGGTLFSYRLYYYQVDHAIHSGTPVVTFGSGVEEPVSYENQDVREEFDTLLADWAKLLRDQPYVFVRGPRTAALLNRHGLTNVRVIGDPALTICDPSLRKPRHIVGINLGCDGKMWGKQSDLTATVTATVRHLIESGWQVDFISMDPSDHAIGQAMARDIGSDQFRVRRPAKTSKAVLDQFAECDFVIGQRLHAIILASGMGVPTIALEYRPKVADFMESIDLMPLSIRTDFATVDGLIAMSTDVIARREGISRHLLQRCDAFRKLQREAASLTLGYVSTHLDSIAGKK